MIAFVVETENPCPCVSAAEAREMTASKNSEVCRGLLARANAEICIQAKRGSNAALVLFENEEPPARRFVKKWLEELGYTVEMRPSAMCVQW